MDKRPLRCVLVSDFNALNFAGYLENDEEAPALEPVETPFGQIIPTLADANHPCWQEQPEFTVVWTQPEKVIPAFQSRLDFQPAATEQLLAAVDEFAALLVGAAARVKALFVPTWVLDPNQRGLGMADFQPNRGLAHTLLQMNLRLAEAVAATPNIFLLDAQRWVTRAGAGAFSAKLWYQGKVPFANAVFQEAVKDVKAAVRGLQGAARKLILVDLDDTLWGGVVGDVGWEHLKLGGHDGMGEAFVDFQRALKALTRRGIVLGIVSKNEESVALAAIRRHPEMQLRQEDFAGWRINWHDKAANVIELAAELNLGLQSVVFLDDNPVERARVREAVPEALVPEWPENPMLYKGALLGLRCFDTPIISEEDAARTQAYVSDRQRTELKRQAGSLDEWLQSLNIQVTVEELDATNLPRATQLLNKTNQLNLATRRLTEAELQAWAAQPGQRVWVFRVADKLGDSGLTGLASLKTDGTRAEVVDFLLSCRVMGRKVEETMVHWLVGQARAAGAKELRVEHLPTAKNKPCLDFWRRSGFTAESEHVFRWATAADYARPSVVALMGAAAEVPEPDLLAVGREVELKCCATAEIVADFITLTGDNSPLHADPDYARRSMYGGILVHGMLPVLFLSALDVCHVAGRRTVFKKVAANFNQPIYLGDPLLLRTTIAEVNDAGAEVELEFQIRHRDSGAVLTTGMATLVFSPAATNAPAPSTSASRSLLREALTGEATGLEQIERGAERSFRFELTEANARFCHGMLAQAVAGFTVDYENWAARCDANNLLASALVSTFVGKCIPGSYGTCMNSDAAFARPLAAGHTYRFTGKVAFKSPSTSSIINQITISDGVDASPCATGKIHAGVKPPPAPPSGQTVVETSPPLPEHELA